MGADSITKSEGKHLSTDKKGKHVEKDDHKHTKQHSDYSKLESGERPRISPEDLGDLVAEADTDTLERYGGVKVCLALVFYLLFQCSTR
jgi:hypothetical protein